MAKVTKTNAQRLAESAAILAAIDATLKNDMHASWDKIRAAIANARR